MGPYRAQGTLSSLIRRPAINIWGRQRRNGASGSSQMPRADLPHNRAISGLINKREPVRHKTHPWHPAVPPIEMRGAQLFAQTHLRYQKFLNI